MNYIEVILHIGCMLFLACITHEFVSTCGKNINEIGVESKSYSVFTFSDDRQESMTTNILMNVFFPNVCMIFIFVGLSYLKWNNMMILLMIYNVSYYIYRMVLICLVLRRKELYNFKYELTVAIFGIILGILLNVFFLKSTKSLFISVSDLKEELWFSIILIIYGFIKSLMDKKIKQDDVLKEEQLIKYIKRRFDAFYLKYAETLDINAQNSYLCILLFAIMIFENFNRGPFIRELEKIKVKTGHSATVGIMQVRSHSVLTNKESIKKAYELIEYYYKQIYENEIYGNELSGYDVEFIAQKYNHDEKYSDSIAFIYTRLLTYIKAKHNYRTAFCLQDNDENINTEYFNCNSINEVCKCLKNNSVINLSNIKTDVLDGVEETVHVRVNRVEDGWELVLLNLRNVEIYGNGSHFYSQFSDANVLVIKNCYNIKISGFKFGHKVDIKECGGNVIFINNSDKIILDKNIMYGCGVYGIYAIESEYECNNSEIYECTNGAIWSEESNVRLSNTKIHDCKNCNSDLIYVSNSILLDNVEIYNNVTELALINTEEDITIKYKNLYLHDNKYRKKSLFDNDLLNVRLERNEHLGWN